MGIKSSTIFIHFIENNEILSRQYSNYTPSIGDEIRLGGKGPEKFYKVTRRVWCYNEENVPYERINIEVVDVTASEGE